MKNLGGKIKPEEISIGDQVLKVPSRSSSGFSGTVYKCGPKNVHVMSKYQFGAATPDNPPQDLDLGKQSRFEINYVNRNGVTYAVIL